MSKEAEGVWRTIRGRRIFIGKGESLGQAMSKSGKFNRSDIRETKAGLSQKDKFDRTNSQSLKQRQKAIKDFRKKDTRYSNSVYTTDKKDEKNRINESSKRWTGGKTRVEQNYDRYSQEDRRELRHENLQKKLADYKAKKQSNNKIENNTIDRNTAIDYANRINQAGYYNSDDTAINKEIKDKYGISTTTMLDIGRLEDLHKMNKLDDELIRNSLKNNPEIKKAIDKGIYKPSFNIDKQSNNKVDPYNEPESNESQRLQSIQSRYDEYLQDTEGRGASYGEIAYVDSLRGKDLDDFEKELDDYETKKYNKVDDFKEWAEKNNIDKNDYQDFVENRSKLNMNNYNTKEEYDKALRDNYLKHNKAKTIKAFKEKKQKDEKEWLPKATEIKEQGKSNRKEVSDNIQAHILEYYGPDYTGEDISPEDAFVRQMDAMKEPTMWKSGQRIAEGGSYLVYNGDMSDFLDSLKINPKGKKFSEDKAFNMYTSLIGRESEKLYNKIKKHQAETINNYKKKKGK